MKADIKAVIGLGNPGKKYYKNRHNIGFRVLDTLAERYNIVWNNSELMEYAEYNKILFIKPLTFMNNSGKVLPYLLKKGIKSEEILVVHDELEKKLGNISLKFSGSAKGHNGLRSIIEVIGQDFWRLCFGIGRPEIEDVGDYVLKNFLPEEESKIPELIQEAISLLE